MNCKICNSYISKMTILKGHQIFSCAHCNHLFCDDIKEEANYFVYKEYEYLLKRLRDKNYNKILKSLVNILPFNAVGLEIGSSLGLFLKKCSKKGYIMTGIEPNRVNYTESLVFGGEYTVINGYFPECLPLNEYKNKFDFIIFNDTLEHIYDTKEAFRICNEILKQNGYLIINLPLNTGILSKIASMLSLIGNSKSLIRLWQFETESPHLHYFSGKSLKTLANKSGFTILSELSLNTVDSNLRNTYRRVLGIGKYRKISAFIIALVIFICIPLWKILPKDIEFFIFKKGNIK